MAPSKSSSRRKRSEEDELEPTDDGDVDEAEGEGVVRRRGSRRRSPLSLPPPDRIRKTIAAAGFVEAARTLGILILTHRRLLVSQFRNDLTTEEYGDRFTDAIERGKETAAAEPMRSRRMRGSPATRTRSPATRTAR